jgi:iron complex outermembrane receptor protein
MSGSLAVSRTTEFFVDARNLANRKAVGDISAVVDYRTLQPFQRAIFYPVERRAVFAGIRTRL